MCMPKGEKKELIKFVPSRNLLRDREIKLSPLLLAWQELGGQRAPVLPFGSSPDPQQPKRHEQHQII